jgi:dCMP deaminase
MENEWADYFHGLAEAASKKSKDLQSPVGAVIVREKLVLATGFNGMARNIPDDIEILSNVEKRNEKLKWICHAEHNAICNAARTGVSCVDATIYVTKFPCFMCLQTIVQAGLKGIATLDTKFWTNDPIDPDGVGKRYVIQAAGLAIDAPRFDGWKYARPELSVGRVVGMSNPGANDTEPEKL